MEIEEQKEEKSLNEENSISLPDENIIEEQPLDILKEIFIYHNSENKIIYSPILQRSNYLYKKLISIFNKQNIESIQDINIAQKFISNRLSILNKIKEIINNSYDIMHIIMNFLSKNNIDPIKDLVDIYILLISSEKIDKNKFINDIKNILNWFLIGGLFNKTHTDYIYQQLSKTQLEKKLSPGLFNDFLSLIELIYGKNYDISLKRNLIEKNYIYFYDKENSMIKTNISKINNIHIKEGCSIIIWFYMNQEEINDSKLCCLNLIKNQEGNNNKIEFILNNNKDIDIKINSNLLKENDGKKFELNKNTWIQLKIQIMKNVIKLNIFQNNEEIKEKNDKDKNQIIRYETKVYYFNNKDILNNNDINIEFCDYNIIDLNFAINFIGYIGTIIFCKNENSNEVPIKSISGLKSSKISKFIKQCGLSDIYFIFSPSLYIKEKNKFIYMNNNIVGEIFYNSLDSLEEEDIKKIIDYNNVYNYSNIIDNIYQIGGCSNILPLFEIFYKFSKNNIETEKDNKLLEAIFLRLIKLIELIIINKPKNFIDLYYNNNNDFFKSMQIFLENINDKFYNKNDNIVDTLLNIGKYIYKFCKDNENKINIENGNVFYFFKFLLFTPKIIIKFSLEQQNKIWNFFEDEKIIPKKDSKYINFSGINLSYCKKCFINFLQLNTFILLFNKKYPDEFLSPDLVNIIKYLFLVTETSDLERESLLLLINENNETHKNRISDKIIISIIEIYTFYFESRNYLNKTTDNIIKLDSKDSIQDYSFIKPNLSLEAFLNSENYFIENLLRILSTNNLSLKKSVINLIKLLSQKYLETLKNYFIKVDTDIKKSRKIKKINKVTGKEFYFFIQENILINYNNESIREKQRIRDQLNQNNKDEDIDKRKSSMDSLNLINKSIEQKNNKLIIQNKPSENTKRKIYRSKTPEEKGIDEIKTRIFQKAKENINIPLKTEINLNDDRISSPYESTSQRKMIRILSLQNPINEFIGKENEEEENEEKNKEMKIIETQKIAMSLFEWLINFETAFPNKRKRYSGRLSSSNIIFEKNINVNFNFSEIVINCFMKLFYSKNLEVINKILYLILGQKTTNILEQQMVKNPNEKYMKLLEYFSESKSKFIQFLEELMINSYLCIYYEDAVNKFNWIESTNYIGIEKGKEEYFKEIYNHSKELLSDIYCYDNKMNNNIINEIFDIVLFLFGGLKKTNEITEENIIIKKILFTFLQEFLNSIADLYKIRYDYYRKILINNNNEKSLIKKEMIKKYICFCDFIFEYLFLLANSNNFISKTFSKKIIKGRNYITLPDFLTYEIDKEGNKKLLDIKIDLYLKVNKKIIDNFNIEKYLKKINNISSIDKKGSIDMNENKEKIKNENDKKNIFYLEPSDINKIIKEFSNNKELKNYLKSKLNLLFSNYDGEFKDFPLIIIISLLNNYYISFKLSKKIDTASEEGINFIPFLNSHMKFILTIIFISSVIKENDNFYINNKSYKDIQETIFDILLFNIHNVIKNFNSIFGEYFIEVFANIMTLMSCLWMEDKEHKSLFGLGKSKQKNALKRTLNYYSTKYKKFFDNPNLEKIASQNVTKNKEMISEEKNNLYDSIIKIIIEDKPENLPLIDIFNIVNYENIYNSRKYNLNHKLKILINEGLDNKIDLMNENEEEKEYYENILYKVDKLKIIYDNNEIYKYCNDIMKRKNYRKIKKRLYSWNNSYSNLDIFYPQNKNKNEEEKNNKYFLKYKMSNYLSSDMTRKLIVPILDIDYYMPKFKIFNYKDKLFNINEKTQINEYENVYRTDLKIFGNLKNDITIEKNKFYSFKVCYIKTTHHIRGKLIFEKRLSNNNIKNPLSLSEPIPSLFFLESNITNKEALLKKFEDYDSESNSCFISIFKNNQNTKDAEIFLRLDFTEITYIFIRKYCFRNNSLEIFLSNHRSYYFKFFDTKEREIFLSELISILNKNNPKNKLYKPIKGLDENNKSIIIGYFKDEENNKEFSSLSNINNLWKNNKISTLEYLMWINIYANRSFRDISQYPVFPWLLVNHEYKTYDDLMKNLELRNFNYPIGLLSNDEKSKKRQEGYIDTYKIMVTNLIDENLLNIKIKDEEDNLELNIANDSSNQSGNNNIPNLTEQIQDKYLPKLPEYKYDIEKLYKDVNFEYEKIPYFFGSHFSNSMYVSHYLMRIFPFCLTMIEIQKTGFDVPDRLFSNLQNSQNSALSDKGDLREIIPEFFTLPEMFLNINRLSLGKVGEENGQKHALNEVTMPTWCENSPFIFCEKYRKILELPNININPWIDLVFGYTQRGVRAQKIGNLFLPYVYDGVMNLRLTKDMLLNDRNENEFKIRYFEMGVHPTRIFDKKNKNLKNKINNQLIDINEKIQVKYPQIKLKKYNENYYIINPTKKIIYFNSCSDDNDEFFILDSNFLLQKINIQESKESDKIFYIKENSLYKEFPIKEKINQNIKNKLIIKAIFKNKFFIIGGFFDGSLIIIKTPNKLSKKEENQKSAEKAFNLPEEKIIKKLDNSVITALEIDKNEKYLIYGTLKGSIIIYYLNHLLFKENKNFLEFKKMFKSHNNFSISSICINSDLGIFADCSVDCYINVYTLSPYNDFRIISSIYISHPFIPNFVFLSAQPLPSIAVYSNDLCKFKCYSINGNELNTTESDNNLMSNKFKEYYVENDQNMNSPLIFTDALFNDYLIYIFKKKYVLIREFPSMKIKIPLNPTMDNHNEELCSLCLSEDKKNLFVLEQNSNKIYMINQKMFASNNK